MEHNNSASPSPKGSGVPKECPHCGQPLTLWQQVILSVDRVLVCKNCWYRIILDVFDDDQSPEKKK